jgi:hypothetical protein
MFRLGAVKAGDQPWVATVPTSNLAGHLSIGGSGFPSSTIRPAALLRPVGFRLVDGPGPPVIPDFDIPQGKRLSSTNEIAWDATDPTTATYTVNAPAVRAAVGYVGRRDVVLGDVSIRVTKAEKDWASVAVGALDGKPVGESSRVLIVAAGRTENSNMGWNEDRTSVSRQWGNAPTVVEGISAKIRLPGDASVAALDAAGRPTAKIPTRNTVGGTEVEIGPQYKTLWYAVTR